MITLKRGMRQLRSRVYITDSTDASDHQVVDTDRRVTDLFLFRCQIPGLAHSAFGSSFKELLALSGRILVKYAGGTHAWPWGPS